MEFDLIVGIHSIAAALENKDRNHYAVLATEDGLKELRSRHKIDAQKMLGEKVKIFSPHQLQDEAKKLYQKLDYEFQRVPSQVLLQSSPLKTYTAKEVIDMGVQRFIALDQVLDVHNGAAIIRTASFFGIEAVILPSERSFGFSPSFYRIASGAPEFIKIIRSSSLPKALGSLKDANVKIFGLSEHAPEILPQVPKNVASCLVLGTEEEGLSHAVIRSIDGLYSLPSQGMIKSLNVSAAAAVALEKCFGQKS